MVNDSNLLHGAQVFINVLFVFTYRYCAKKLDSLLSPEGRSVNSTRSSADFDASMHVSLSRPKLVGLVRSKSEKYKINKYHHDFFFFVGEVVFFEYFVPSLPFSRRVRHTFFSPSRLFFCIVTTERLEFWHQFM